MGYHHAPNLGPKSSRIRFLVFKPQVWINDHIINLYITTCTSYLLMQKQVINKYLLIIKTRSTKFLPLIETPKCTTQQEKDQLYLKLIRPGNDINI